MAIGKQLSDGNPSGTGLGQDTADLISFYGQEPVSRYASSVVAAVSTAAVSFAATPWGFASSAQADAVIRMAWHVPRLLAAVGLATSS